MDNTLNNVFNQKKNALSKVVNDINLSAKKEITELVESTRKKYDNLIVDDVQENKKVVAKINAEKKELDDQRKLYKKLILETFYNELDVIFKDGFADVDEIKDKINDQIKEVELKEKAEKLDVIRSLVSNVDIDMHDDLIINPKWLNKTYSMTKIKNELLEFKEKYDKEIRVLEKIGDKTMLSYYKKGHSLAETLALVDAVEVKPHSIQVYYASDEEFKKLLTFLIKEGYEYN